MLRSLTRLLLSRFYSKNESTLIAHQAMPSGVCTVVVSEGKAPEWGEVTNFIPPEDGYLTAIGQASEPLGFLHALGGDAENVPSQSNSVGQGQWLYVSVPVVKGRNCYVWADKVQQIRVIFNKVIGVWGGVLNLIGGIYHA